MSDETRICQCDCDCYFDECVKEFSNCLYCKDYIFAPMAFFDLLENYIDEAELTIKKADLAKPSNYNEALQKLKDHPIMIEYSKLRQSRQEAKEALDFALDRLELLKSLPEKEKKHLREMYRQKVFKYELEKYE